MRSVKLGRTSPAPGEIQGEPSPPLLLARRGLTKWPTAPPKSYGGLLSPPCLVTSMAGTLWCFLVPLLRPCCSKPKGKEAFSGTPAPQCERSVGSCSDGSRQDPLQAGCPTLLLTSECAWAMSFLPCSTPCAPRFSNSDYWGGALVQGGFLTRHPSF